MKPALLVIDVQNEFFNLNQACSDSLKVAIGYINAAIGLFRRKNLPIVMIQHKSEEEVIIPGKSGFDVPQDVRLEPQDMRIIKTYGNSFNKTGLGVKLRRGSLASDNAEHIRFVEEITETISIGALKALL